MRLITISGLDGSGKSTQVEMLIKYLESQSKKVFYFHAVSFSVANYFKKNKPGENKSVTRAGNLQIFLRRIFLMIDLLRFRKLIRKLNSTGYNYLVSDRYFYDSVINIKYLSGKNKTLPCEKFIIRPDIAIFLKTNPEIIMQRERVPDQGIEYLKNKYDLYNQAGGEWDLKIVDGNRNREEIFEELKNIMK